MRGEFLAWAIRGAGIAVGVAFVLGLAALGAAAGRVLAAMLVLLERLQAREVPVVLDSAAVEPGDESHDEAAEPGDADGPRRSLPKAAATDS